MEKPQELGTELKQLKLLLEVSTKISSNFDLKNLCKIILQSLRKVMHCDHAGLFFPEENGEYLSLYSYDFPYSKGIVKTGMRLPIRGSNTGKAYITRKIVLTDHLDLSKLGKTVTEIVHIEKLHSSCFLPLIINEKILGILHVARIKIKPFSENEVNFLEQVAHQTAISVNNAFKFKEVQESEKRLQEEKLYLKKEIESESYFGEIVGQCSKIKAVIKQIIVVAPTDSTVLIQGETGTGKELIARAVHNNSNRKDKNFVKFNCSAIPLGLLESELFGHEKGAFTGAIERKTGRFELADKGTLFLDEIGDIPLELQSKLLRVIQEQEFERLGSTKTIKVNVRLIAATNKALIDLVDKNKFRSDLFYRLNVFPINVPSLRERKDDIPLLIRHFAKIYSSRMKKEINEIPKNVLKDLTNYYWPGNIRELQNIIERAVILLEGRILRPLIPELKNKFQSPIPETTNLEELEKEHIIKILQKTEGVISGPHGAATLLGLKRSTLRSKMEKLEISKDTYK